jgi:hypothetical protein
MRSVLLPIGCLLVITVACEPRPDQRDPPENVSFDPLDPPPPPPPEPPPPTAGCGLEDVDEVVLAEPTGDGPAWWVVDSITDDEDRVIDEVQAYDADGDGAPDELHRIIWTYDDAGRVVAFTVSVDTNMDGNVDAYTSTTWTLDDEGWLLASETEERPRPDGALLRRTRTEYLRDEPPGTTVTTTWVDSDGDEEWDARWQNTTVLDEAGQLVRAENETDDPLGDLLEYRSVERWVWEAGVARSLDGEAWLAQSEVPSSTWHTVWQYDELGRRGAEIRETDLGGDGSVDTRSVHTFTYREDTIWMFATGLLVRDDDGDGDADLRILDIYGEDGRILRTETDREADGELDSVSYFTNPPVCASDDVE